MTSEWISDDELITTLPNAMEHTVNVYESHNMAAVRAPRPESNLHAGLQCAANAGAISRLQFETAWHGHDAVSRRTALGEAGAFFLGDATGMGKTRSAAAIFTEQVLRLEDDDNVPERTAEHRDAAKQKHRVLWVSCRSELEDDVRRNVGIVQDAAIGWRSAWCVLQGAEVRPKYDASGAKINKRKRTSMQGPPVDARIAFTTYGTLRRGIDVNGHLDDLITSQSEVHLDDVQGPLAVATQFLQEGDVSLIVFDEAHVAKSPRSATGLAVRVLQAVAKTTGVVYCTATAASDITNLGYMTRIGLFHAFLPDAPFDSYENMVQELRREGSSALEMIALNLKSRGLYVSRCLAQPVSEAHDSITLPLTPSQRALYDACVEQWCNTGNPSSGKLSVSVKQNFFMRLLASFKAINVLPVIDEALAQGKAVVVSLQSTGSSAAASHHAEDPYPSSCREAMRSCNIDTSGMAIPMDAIDIILERYRDRTAEVTGRRLRRKPGGGNCEMEKRTQTCFRRELEEFQTGKRDVAILSAAGGTGTALHATDKDPRQRVHLLLELPWSSEAFVQQCGRTHRADQVVPPMYRVVTTDVPMESRILLAITTKLARLGALTRGDCMASLGSCSHHVDTIVSTDVMRRALFEVLCREAWAVYALEGPEPLRPINRRRARNILKVGDGWNEMRIRERAADCLTHALTYLEENAATTAWGEGVHPGINQSEHHENLLRYLGNLLSAIRQLIPEICLSHSIPVDSLWTKERFASLAPGLRKRMRSVLLAARHKDCGLSRLPGEMVERILDMVADDGWRVSPVEVVRHLGRANITRRAMFSEQSKSLLSRFTCVPTHVQSCVWTAVQRAFEASEIAECEQHQTQDVAPRGAIDVLQYCYPHGVPPDCTVKLEQLPDQMFRAGHLQLKASLCHDPGLASGHEEALLRVLEGTPPSLPAFGVWETIHSRSLRCVVPRVKRGASWDIEVWSPGLAKPSHRLTFPGWEEWREKHLFAAVDITQDATRLQISTRWQQASEAHYIKRRAQCELKTRTVTLIAASHAFDHWNTSHKVLVRAGPPLLPAPLIGVATPDYVS